MRSPSTEAHFGRMRRDASSRRRSLRMRTVQGCTAEPMRQPPQRWSAASLPCRLSPRQPDSCRNPADRAGVPKRRPPRAGTRLARCQSSPVAASGRADCDIDKSKSCGQRGFHAETRGFRAGKMLTWLQELHFSRVEPHGAPQYRFFQSADASV